MHPFALVIFPLLISLWTTTAWFLTSYKILQGQDAFSCNMLVVKLTMWLISAMFSKKRKAKVVHFSSPELSVTVASFWKQRSDTLPVVKSQRPFRLKRRHVTNWSMTRLRMLDHLEKGIWCMSWNSSRLVWVNRYLLNSAILDQLAQDSGDNLVGTARKFGNPTFVVLLLCYILSG